MLSAEGRQLNFAGSESARDHDDAAAAWPEAGHAGATLHGHSLYVPASLRLHLYMSILALYDLQLSPCKVET